MSNYLKLETILQEQSESPDVTPQIGQRSLFKRYDSLLEHLRSEIYPQIDVALSNLSARNGFFTLHDAHHFDQVVKMAEYLVIDSSNRLRLSVYELFILLIAIRIHDAGNIEGREEHEQKCRKILDDAGHGIGLDEFEKVLISKIAGAHGGKLADGSKDTIRNLKESTNIGTQIVRTRLIAAIVRFADELADNSRRTNAYMIRHNLIKKENEIYHRYAKSIYSTQIQGDTVEVIFHLQEDDLIKKYGKEVYIEEKASFELKKIYLVSEIRERLKKMYLEKYYCNQFFRPKIDLRKISVTVEYFTNGYQEELMQPDQFLLIEDGYPTSERIKNMLSSFKERDIHQKASAAKKELQKTGVDLKYGR